MYCAQRGQPSPQFPHNHVAEPRRPTSQHSNGTAQHASHNTQHHTLYSVDSMRERCGPAAARMVQVMAAVRARPKSSASTLGPLPPAPAPALVATWLSSKYLRGRMGLHVLA